MPDANHHHAAHCPECEPQPVLRNHWFLGKLVTPRDLTDEHRYVAQKLRLHHQRLHGTGIVCGLEVSQHGNPLCQDRLVRLHPGSAIDCCGHDILVLEEDTIDLMAFPAFRSLVETPEGKPHRLRLCLRHRECPTEEVPVLFDECACDDTDCAPNRILETYAVDLVVDPPEPEPKSVLTPRLRRLATVGVPEAGAIALDEGPGRMLLTATESAKSLVYRTLLDGLVPKAPVHLDRLAFALAVDPSARLLAVAVAPDTVTDPLELHVYDLDGTLAAPERKLTIPASAGSKMRMRCAPGTGEMVTLTLDGGKVAVWKKGLPDGEAPRELDAGGDSIGLAIGTGGTLAYTLRDGAAKVVEVQLGSAAPPREITLPAGFSHVALDAALSTGPDLIALAGTEGGKGRLLLFDPKGAGSAVGQAVELHGEPADIAVSPGGGWAYVVGAESGKGWLQPVNLHQLRAGKQPKAGAVLDVAEPLAGVTVDAAGRRLYLLHADGVVIVEVDEADCGALLDGGACPSCLESDCLTLATIRGWKPGAKLLDGDDATGDPPAGTAWIDNADGRVVLPSTQAIAAALRCLMEHAPAGGGTQGPPGQNGTNGEDGLGIDAVNATFVNCTVPGAAAIVDIAGVRTLRLTIPKGCDGKDGVGAGEKLVRIAALSWEHRKPSLLATIVEPSDTPGRPPRTFKGLVIGFTGDVVIGFALPARNKREEIEHLVVDAEHVFQVLARPRRNAVQDTLLDCRCPLAGNQVVPVRITRMDGRLIREAEIVPGPIANAAAYLLNEDALGGFNRFVGQELWAVLRGDFVCEPDRDERGRLALGRAIDAEFVRADLPTGDRPKGADLGIQGGLFESWFPVTLEG
ncbi:YncE family protein [Paracraurococcus lichenis]|uniref:Uncharacterized protein n=1 Tax=Paracraurococcus lichenis TaxID=3064888 RepID=A0ABT9EA08_9PROT|nr:hypothetical protein [Paracraurococcus sp. LOR1-02]MDO9712895.1 hypothetical protein [Paracraurococcus sp. LOR1-02]